MPHFVMPPPVDEKDHGQYRKSVWTKINNLGNLLVAAKKAGRDDDRSRIEISILKYSLAQLKPLGNQILDAQQHKIKLEEKANTLRKKIREL